MTGKSTVRVKTWFAVKLGEEAHGRHCQIEWGDGEREKLRVEEVFAETEKAIHVLLDAETFSGSYIGYKVWIPKSVIIE